MRRNLLSKGLFIVLALTSANASQAFSPGDTKVLTQIYAQMKEQLETLKDELEEVKAVNDELFQAREYLQAVRHEYEFVTRFDPDGELRSLVNWSDGMTNLNDLDSGNWQQRWRLLSSEVDKRFKRSNASDPLKEASKDAALEDFSEIEQTAYLRDYYRNRALSDTPKSTKDLHRQTASSTAMMTSIMLEERTERLEKEAAKRQRLMDGLEWDHQFMQFLGGAQ